MATSSKRQGLENLDLEQESRMRRIETLLDGLTTEGGGGSGETRRSATVPNVTGLRVSGKTPGTVTLTWNAVRITNFRKYELLIAEDLAFTVNKQSFDLAALTKQISTIATEGASGNKDVFAKIRAYSSSGNVGNFSAPLNTATGQAETGDIADSAVTSSKVGESVAADISLPRGYIDGYRYSQNAEFPNTMIDIAPGSCRNSTNNGAILQGASVLTKDISLTWAAGTEQGGFPTTYLALPVGVDAPVWYRVFVIGRLDQPGTDAGFDTAEDAENLINQMTDTDPSFLNANYRQIGWVYYRDEASGGIWDFTSRPDDPEQILFTLSTQWFYLGKSNVYYDYTFAGAPPSCDAMYSLQINMQSTSKQDYMYFYLRPHYIPKALPTSTSSTFVTREQKETDMIENMHFMVSLDENQGFWFRMRRSNGGYSNSHVFKIFVDGFVYKRGRDA
tara:strand:+ start:3200 stop:4543 length:1344 start_codon:yes stop_codon:yes gene_type:complete